MSKASESVLKAKEVNNLNSIESPVKKLSEISKEKLDMITKDLILPSKGIPYGGSLPDGKVKIRMMKVSDTKLLFSSSVSHYERLNQLLTRILIDCPLNVESFTLADKFYIIVQSRILSLDNIYKCRISCPSCQYINNLQIDLEQLDVKNMTEEQMTQKVTLPISGREFTLKQMLVSDELSSSKYLISEKARAEKDGRKVGEEELISYTLACQTESISGLDKDMSTKLEFINNMVSRDYEAVQKAIKQMEFGINIDLFSPCTKCSYEINFSLPFDAEFFRPKIY